MTTSTAVTDSIATCNKKFVSTFKAGDAAGLGALYTKNGRLLPPNSDPVEGTEAIAAFWKGAMEMGIKEVTLKTVALDDHGDTAIEEGRFQLKSADGNIADRGKYIVVWKQKGDTWKLHQDIWNSSNPPA